MGANSLHKDSGAPGPGRPVQDEWGLFDPDQVGMPALHRRLEDERAAPAAPSSGNVAPDARRAAHCPFCTEPLPAGARRCPLCLRNVSSGGISQPQTITTAAAQPSVRPQGGAVYALESPVRCPECAQEIHTLRVLRVLRTQVSFTSTLPRKGYVILCPHCERLLSAELSGLI